MIDLKVENNSDDYSYLAMLLQQTQQAQNNGTAAATFGSRSSAASVSLTTDSLEISSDAYRAYSEGRGSSKSDSDILDGLVSDGTITGYQEDSILNAMNSSTVTVSDNSNPLKSTLDRLVSSGTITAEQKGAIASAFAPADDSNSSSAFSVLNGLSSSDISDSSPAKGKMAPPPPPDASGDDEDDDEDDYLDKLLQNLVDNGTLSSNQQDTVEGTLSSASNAASDDSNPPRSGT